MNNISNSYTLASELIYNLLFFMARSKKSKLSAGDAFVLWLKDERLSKILAILCFMMALFILISSISYFFTWKADQDKILNYSWKILFNPKVVITNWLGKLGALSSHILFYYGFGLAAILFIPVLIHLGFRFLHRLSLIHI